MKITCLASSLILSLLSGYCFAFDIYALGTSATNCKGVDRDKIFTVKLEQFLRADGFDAHVINGGEDGDRPIWMMRRLNPVLDASVRLVIFEPGPNDPNQATALQYTEKILGILGDHGKPTVYASTLSFQTPEDAAEMAKKYGAYYYGSWRKGVPVDNEHCQFDAQKGGKGPCGHMTSAGCEIVARQMTPLIEKILREKGIQ